MISLKQNAYQKLVPIYGEGETRALIRALEEDLLVLPQITLDGHDLSTWNEAVRRLMNHEPVAYITGKAYFLHLKLKVNKWVLIPRPETETLVTEAIEQLRNITRPRVLDIGTGSGCIALAIRSAFKESEVFGLDIEDQVLKVAQENALQYQLSVEWLLSDILKQEEWPSLPYDLDIIISNPPYIQEIEKKYMSVSTLEFEPASALFAGDDPVRFYKAIVAFGLTHLKPGGRIMVEINEFLVGETMAAMNISGFTNPEWIQDLSGKNRIIYMVKL